MTSGAPAPHSYVVVGIDPGTVVMGLSAVRVTGNVLELLAMEAVKFSTKKEPLERLADIHESVRVWVARYQPEVVALEAPFFGKNVQSMLKLGRAQGVAMGVALANNLPVFEYSPTRVKQSITGSGSATKEKVAGMLQSIYAFRELPQKLDATDGLAVATCHIFSTKTPSYAQTLPGQTQPIVRGVLQEPALNWQKGMKKRAQGGASKNAWASFVQNNPDKLRS
jgi:crossover junction endodeoxyribonuclease RuvC